MGLFFAHQAVFGYRRLNEMDEIRQLLGHDGVFIHGRNKVTAVKGIVQREITQIIGHVKADGRQHGAETQAEALRNQADNGFVPVELDGWLAWNVMLVEDLLGNAAHPVPLGEHEEV